MLGRVPLHRITIDVTHEQLRPGPMGSRLTILDYDGVRGRYYEPVNLDDPALLLQDGLDPTEADPRFHQQMVYAVAMKVIENFEVALGRRIHFYRRKPLLLLPHAFAGANAYYSSRRQAILFGYFSADAAKPGSNIPGQNVFSCLSQDIIAHEVTHAIVDRLRRFFKWPTNPDMLAFHEGFADIVAIFQHFSFPEILNHAIQETHGDLRRPTPLIELAAQFGQATGKGEALRTALDRPDAAASNNILEPHQRGSILVAAVFDGFFTTFQSRIQDLLRLASGGTGRLPEGYLHPDLVNRLAQEARATAQAVLRMCIRAFDYLPPVDVTFGDYLRALVTADYELNPDDRSGLRRNMVEAFRVRGIYPHGVRSLAEDSLLWERFDAGATCPDYVISELNNRLLSEAASSSRSSTRDQVAEEKLGRREEKTLNYLARELRKKAWESFDKLDLASPHTVRTNLVSMHPVFRIGQDGQLLVETVIQFVQERRRSKSSYGGVAMRGGSTVIAQADGRIRYVISKPLDSTDLRPEKAREGKEREMRFESFLRDFDCTDACQIWRDERYHQERLVRGLTLAMVDRRGAG